jgi:hypothetical protein
MKSTAAYAEQQNVVICSPVHTYILLAPFRLLWRTNGARGLSPGLGNSSLSAGKFSSLSLDE